MVPLLGESSNKVCRLTHLANPYFLFNNLQFLPRRSPPFTIMFYGRQPYAVFTVVCQQLNTWAVAQTCKFMDISGTWTLVGLVAVLALLTLLSGLLFILQRCLSFLM